jgi:hypothetical protein
MLDDRAHDLRIEPSVFVNRDIAKPDHAPHAVGNWL